MAFVAYPVRLQERGAAMESIYWVMAWACHRACRHCYETRFRPYVRSELAAVVAQAEANTPRVIANLPPRMTYRDGDADRVGRIVLSGGEALLDAVRERVTYTVIEALQARYRDHGGVRVVVQTTGDLLTPAIVSELLRRGVWMISVAGIDDFHVGHQGAERQAALTRDLAAMFDAAGMRRSGHAAPVRAWNQEDGPVYSFFGATPDMWIGKLWPRGRAWRNGLSTATMAENFCAQWSGGKGFLDYGQAGSEVSIEPDGSVYPCCVKTGAALGDLTEERLTDILDSLRHEPALAAINRGEPDAMGLEHGWDAAAFHARSHTVTPQGAPYANLCIGCDAFHAEVLGPILAAIRNRRLAIKDLAA